MQTNVNARASALAVRVLKGANDLGSAKCEKHHTEMTTFPSPSLRALTVSSIKHTYTMAMTCLTTCMCSALGHKDQHCKVTFPFAHVQLHSNQPLRVASKYLCLAMRFPSQWRNLMCVYSGWQRCEKSFAAFAPLLNAFKAED